MKTPLNTPQSSLNKPRPCLDLTIDAVFKHFFKRNEDLCKDILKQFIPPLHDQKITHLSYIDSSLSSDKNKDKQSILDILVQINDREKINIEMQCVSKAHFKERILFYWSKLFSSQLESGNLYEKLCPTYSLVFTDYTLLKDLKNYYSSFSLRCDEERSIVFSPYLRIVVVELCKLKESFEKLDRKGLWSYLIRNSSVMKEKDLEKISLRGEVMSVAVRKLKKMSEEESMRLIAEAEEKARRDRAAEIQYGIDTGFERGVKSGISQNTQEVALKMIHEGITRSIVSKITGLSLDQLSKLKKEHS